MAVPEPPRGPGPGAVGGAHGGGPPNGAAGGAAGGVSISQNGSLVRRPLSSGSMGPIVGAAALTSTNPRGNYLINQSVILLKISFITDFVKYNVCVVFWKLAANRLKYPTSTMPRGKLLNLKKITK